MGYPENVLARDEQVVLHRHPHWGRLLIPAFVLILASAAAAFLAGYVNTLTWEPSAKRIVFLVIAAVWLILIGWLSVWPFLNWWTTHFVITDRRVLDKQLQDTISQFEHKVGVVQVISENSAQLAKALNDGAPIVVTTLQKFGFILDKVGELGTRRFALIVDEAHSSQTGSAARKLREALTKGKGSMLGAASGAVAGLVAVTPAAGFVGPMGSIVLGLLAGLICLWGVNGLKRMLGADDAFDVFGVHGVGGILGALLTGVLASQSLGGTGGLTPDTFAMGSQLWVQFKSVLLTIVWSGVVAFIAYKIADMAIGLRVTEEEEREGLDISSHGEAAYSK